MLFSFGGQDLKKLQMYQKILKILIAVYWGQLRTLECLLESVWCLGIGKDQHVPAVFAVRHISAELWKSLNFVHELSEKTGITSSASNAFLTVAQVKPRDCCRAIRHKMWVKSKKHICRWRGEPFFLNKDLSTKRLQKSLVTKLMALLYAVSYEPKSGFAWCAVISYLFPQANSYSTGYKLLASFPWAAIFSPSSLPPCLSIL